MGVTDGVTRINPGEKTERKEILALTIEQACEAMKKLLSSGLNRKAIVTLVQADTALGKREIESVLSSLEGLAKTYCRCGCGGLVRGKFIVGHQHRVHRPNQWNAHEPRWYLERERRMA